MVVSAHSAPVAAMADLWTEEGLLLLWANVLLVGESGIGRRI